MKDKPFYFKFLAAQIILYLFLFLSFNNKSYFIPIILFSLFLFWELADWRQALWLTLVACLPFSLSFRNFSFPSFLPSYFITPGGKSEMYYSIPLTAQYLLTFILFLGSVFETKTKPKWNTKEWLLFVLILLLALSSYFSFQPAISFVALVAFIIPLIIYKLAKEYAKSPKIWNLTMQILTIILLFEGGWAVLQFLLQHPLGRILEREIIDSPLGIYSQETFSQFRSSATLSHPNTLAIFLGILLPIVSSFLALKRPIFPEKKVVYLATFAGILGFIFTLSRWAWFSLFLVFLPYFWQQKERLKDKRILVGLSLILLFLMPTIWPRLVSLREISFETYNSWQSRQDLITEALFMIKARPYLGVGSGNFLPVLAENNFTGVANYFFYPVHNLYLFLASQWGIAAFIVWLTFVFLHLKELLIKNFKSSDTRNLKRGFALAIIFYLLAGLGYAGTGINYDLFFLILGLSASLK